MVQEARVPAPAQVLAPRQALVQVQCTNIKQSIGITRLVCAAAESQLQQRKLCMRHAGQEQRLAHGRKLIFKGVHFNDKRKAETSAAFCCPMNSLRSPDYFNGVAASCSAAPYPPTVVIED